MNVLLFNNKSNHNTQIIYIHGGGYVLGINDGHVNLAKYFVNEADVTIHMPDYPLAPHHQYNETYEKMIALYESILQGTSPDNIIFMGDSAGGGLSLGISQYLKELDLPQPSQIILLSPWLDITMENPDALKYDKNDVILGIPGLLEFGKVWAGDADPQNYMLSPINGPLEGTAPITMIGGTYEVFYPDFIKLTEKANSSNINITFYEYNKMLHVFPLFGMPESDDARLKIVQKIKQ